MTSDLEQKAYLNLVFCKLKCVLSKDLIIAEPCTEADIKEAQAFFKKFNEIAISKPVSRFREIQSKLARSILYYQKARVLGSSTPASEEESTWLLKCALNLAMESNLL